LVAMKCFERLVMLTSTPSSRKPLTHSIRIPPQ
jgi:hypothetical protein